MALWKGAVGVAAAVSVCACQLVSGLDDLDARGGAVGGGGASSAESASAAQGAGGGGGVGGSAGGGGGGVDPCSMEDCGPVLIHDTMAPVNYLATDGANLYWASKGTANAIGSVRRAPIDGSQLPSFVASAQPSGLAVDDVMQRLCWTDVGSGGSSVKAVSILDGAALPDIAASAAGVEWRALLVAGGGQIFWADITNKVILKAGFAGPYFSPTGAPFVLASDATSLFWFDVNSIDVAPLSGGDRSLIAQTFPNTRGLAVDDQNVYWTVRGMGGSVWGNSKTVIPGSGTPLAMSQPFPTHVFAAGKFIYFSNDGTDDCQAGSGKVLRRSASLDFGAPLESLATKQVCPSNFVKDALYVYWGSGTRIYRHLIQ